MIGNFLILVIIGAAVGYAMLHYGSTWLRRQFATTVSSASPDRSWAMRSA
jgi:hypothetical protein